MTAKEDKTKKEAPEEVTVTVYRKTYGVRGLMSWRINLPTGYYAMPFVSVSFEGGQITGYGVSPARYTTDDTFIQNLIEQTAWYRNGRIVCLRSVPVASYKKKVTK